MPSPLDRARELVAENREADAATLLERLSSPEATALHHEIALRAATAALQARDIAAATAWLDRGLARNPADAALNFFRGNLHLDSGHASAAVGCFRHCVATDPRRQEYAVNLAAALLAVDAVAEASALLAGFPDSAPAQLLLGNAHDRAGNSSAALTAYERAGRLQPDLFEAWSNLGALRARLGELPAALSAFSRAVALRPTSAAIHLERGRVLDRLQSLPEAAASFARSRQLDPSSAAARLELAHARLRLCDWTEFARLRDDVVAPAVAAAAKGRLIEPFMLLALPGVATAVELREVAAARAARLGQGAVALRAQAAIPIGRPLRIGYVSPDFGNHAVGNCLRSLLGHHDRSRVTIHAFSLRQHPDNEYRSALRAGVDSWDEFGGLSVSTAASRIAEREIDILVDLAGHTRDGGLPLFAWHLAPRQVSWLGYPGTTGAASISHLLADAQVLPASAAAGFSESVVHLPGCYLPCDDSVAPAAGTDTRAEHGLPESGFVFCAFNNAYKIEPVIFSAWMEILRRTPGSVLWLRQCGAATEANLRREAEARGIEARRLVFENAGLPKAEHLARHRAAGLFLDTHFYNAHSTAADALRAGLPVLTFPGQAFPARVGLSLITTLGLADDLVADSMQAYVERAVQLATEPDRLAALRGRLQAAIIRPGGLFDSAAFARKLEDAFAQLAVRQE